MPIGVAVRLWPTASTSDGNGIGAHGEGSADLRTAVAQSLPRWSEWFATHAKGGGSWSDYAKLRGHPEDAYHPDGTPRRVSPVPMPSWEPEPSRLWPTPTALDGKGSSEAYRVRKDGKERDRLDVVAGDTKDGRLNPAWVESLLMGWPLGWTEPDGDSLAHAPAPPHDEEIAPRLTTHKPNRRDRLRLTGNGVVTETAAKVYAALLG